MLILTDDEVKAAVPMDQAIEVNEAAFRSLESGAAQCPDRALLTTTGGPTLFKPACVPPAGAGDGEPPGGARAEALGLKVVSVREANPELGLPSVPATMLMFDAATGLPSALLAATWLTALRTAAGSAVATRALAPEQPELLVVFGAGMQGDAHVDAMLSVRPSLARVAIVNRSLPRAQELAAAVSARAGVETEAVSNPSSSIYPVFRPLTGGCLQVALGDEAAVERLCRAADIICTATNSSTPLFQGAWLKSGCHLNCIGSYTPDMQEVDAATVERSWVVVDEPGARESSGDLVKAAVSEAANGLRTLGNVLLSPPGAEGRGGRELTLFKSVGVAVQDVATGGAAATRAAEMGIGAKAQL